MGLLSAAIWLPIAFGVLLFGLGHDANARAVRWVALLGWLARLRRAPRACYVVHGEPLAAYALRDEIERRFRWQASVPAPGQSVTLEAGR